MYSRVAAELKLSIWEMYKSLFDTMNAYILMSAVFFCAGPCQASHIIDCRF